MAIQLIEGFEHIVATPDDITYNEFSRFFAFEAPGIEVDWFVDSSAGVSDECGPMVISSDYRINGQCLRVRRSFHNSGANFNGQNDLDLRTGFSSNPDLACVGFAFKFDEIPAQAIPLVAFSYDDGATDEEQCSIWLSPSGILFASGTDYNRTTTAAQTATVLSAGSETTATPYGTVNLLKWQYVEVQLDLSGATPELRVDLNGTNVLLITEAAVQKDAADIVNAVRIVNPKAAYWAEGAYSMFIDDVYTLDNSGTEHLSILGPQHIELVAPTSNSQAEWAVTAAASNWAAVAPRFDIDDLSEYITNDNAGDEDLYNMADLADVYAAINAVAVGVVIEIDTGSENVTLAAHEGASNVSGSFSIDDTAPTFFQYVAQTAGDDSAWTRALVNTMIVGVENA